MISASLYNFYVQHDEGGLLFNAFSGGLITFDGPDATECAAALLRPDEPIDIDDVPGELAADLFDQGFLITEPNAQINEIRSRFSNARSDTPMVVTITTTLECNLGCYYCYQERSAAQLELADIPSLVADTRSRLVASGKKTLHVDWYGGEPLINLAFLESASATLQAMCCELKVQYRASIISNGTLWPDDVAGFVSRHKIQQVQISFDGMQERHDKIRRFRDADTRRLTSSFILAADLIDRLSRVVRVDARINLDRKNVPDVVDFLKMATARNWFDRPFPVVVQPARVSDFSEKSRFLKSHQLSVSEFDALRQDIREAAGNTFAVQEAEIPDGFPYPKSTVCAALATDSFVLGADRRIFRCGLQVSEPERAVRSIPLDQIAGSRTVIKIVSDKEHQRKEEQKTWWDNFDPCSQTTCSKCSFLPICWGGCAKKHLENDRASLDEQGLYWRTNLPRLLLEAAGITTSSSKVFSLSDQFRTVGQ